MKHEIDATGKKLGRLATAVATILMDKNTPSFRKNLAPTNKVEIKNASKMDMSVKRLQGIVHTRYSGYPGGQTQTKGENIISTKGYEELIRHAVSRMIPRTKHHSNMLKNLIVHE